ncbi:MAG: hypothetical protein IKK48_04530 [Firmicutes bacterium]|nr:hypothetical protein [Bacillota bacterium]
MPDRDFTFEIEEHFGIISSREDGWNKELNLVRWNGAAAKYDIREWDEHHEQMRRGVTLTPWEMRKVVDLFVSRNNHAAVAKGRAIEAERNARRVAARRKAAIATEEAPMQVVELVSQAETEEQQALEGALPPLEEDTAAEVLLENETQAQDENPRESC